MEFIWNRGRGSEKRVWKKGSGFPFLSLFHFGNNICRVFFPRLSLFNGRLKKQQQLFEEMRPFQEKINVTKKGDPLVTFSSYSGGGRGLNCPVDKSRGQTFSLLEGRSSFSLCEGDSSQILCPDSSFPLAWMGKESTSQRRKLCPYWLAACLKFWVQCELGLANLKVPLIIYFASQNHHSCLLPIMLISISSS